MIKITNMNSTCVLHQPHCNLPVPIPICFEGRGDNRELSKYHRVIDLRIRRCFRRGGLVLTELARCASQMKRAFESGFLRQAGGRRLWAAIPTILYLSKQVRDADRHQKTSFAIQVRRHEILATRTRDIAYTAIAMIDLYLKRVPEGQAPDIRDVDRETIMGIIHHLRDTTISTFEGEIANPMVLPAYGTSLIVEKGYNGDDKAAFAAPGIAMSFFENIAKQAEGYLAEMKSITGRG